jgi:hypothetical protein
MPDGEEQNHARSQAASRLGRIYSARPQTNLNVTVRGREKH